MKKTLSIVVIAILTLAVCMTTVFAMTDFTVVLTASATKVEKGGEVEVVVALANFTAGETGINAIGLTIDYDKAVFETLTDASLSVANNWGTPTFNPANGQIAMDCSTYKAENHDMLKIKFKVKETAAVGNTVVTIKDVNGGNPSGDVYPADQKITLTVQDKAATPAPTPTTPQNTAKPENTATTNPTTGFEDYTVPAILAISVLGIVAYVRYTRLEK